MSLLVVPFGIIAIVAFAGEYIVNNNYYCMKERVKVNNCFLYLFLVASEYDESPGLLQNLAPKSIPSELNSPEQTREPRHHVRPGAPPNEVAAKRNHCNWPYELFTECANRCTEPKCPSRHNPEIACTLASHGNFLGLYF